MMKELSLQHCRLDGRYDVQALLGRGSYAEIYVARDILASPNAPHGQVVIKALNVFLQNDLDADLERTLVENFQNEAIALDRVRHPNVISRLGHGTAKDLRGMVFHYLVLEYLPGGDLAKACPKQGMPPAQALKYLEQVCAGLAHAHQSGIIHRDIKPQNLLLARDRETVKIADFGVARVSLDIDAPITRVGTNMYAPPEHSPVFGADSLVVTVEKLTPAADIYSLAKSTYVLLTGESPRRFSNAPISDLPLAARHHPWSNELLRVLQKATQNQPSERQQSVNDFWRELSRINFAADADKEDSQTLVTTSLHPVPQAADSKDFSPEAPVLPKFNTSRDLKLRNGVLEEANPRLVVKLNGDEQPIQPSPQPRLPEQPETVLLEVPVKRRNAFLRKVLIFGGLLAIFAGALFATQSYLRNKSLLQVQNPFRKPEGVALIDINLRPTAGVDSPPIGLVPRNSRVRIVNTKDNWYEIDIIEYSRPKDDASNADHGWVNKRYIDMQE